MRDRSVSRAVPAVLSALVAPLFTVILSSCQAANERNACGGDPRCEAQVNAKWNGMIEQYADSIRGRFVNRGAVDPLFSPVYDAPLHGTGMVQSCEASQSGNGMLCY